MNALVKSTPSFGEATRHFIEAGIPEKALIPIVPHDAEISGKANIDSKSRGKAPGRFLPRDEKWCGLGKNHAGDQYIAEGATTEDVRERANWPTRNAGLLGRHFPAIDSDAASENARHLIEAALERAFGAEAQFVAERVRGAGPRRLYAFECSAPDAPNAQVHSWSLKYRLPGDPEGEFPHGLDIIGHGKQFVATGIHPSGELYRWDPKYDLCDLYWANELARIDDAGMCEFRAVLIEAVEAVGGDVQGGAAGGNGGGEARDWSNAEPAMPVTAIFRGLERLRNNEATFPSRENFVAVLAKIRAALGCEAEPNRDRIEDWACQDPVWCSPEYFEKVWDSLEPSVHQERTALDRLFRDHRIFPTAPDDFPLLTQEEKDSIANAQKEAKRARDELLDEFAAGYVLSRANVITDEKTPTIRRKKSLDIGMAALNWWQLRTDDLNVPLVQKLRTCGRYTPDESGLWKFIRDIQQDRPEIAYTGTTLNPNFERGEIVTEYEPDGGITRKLNIRYQSPVIRSAKKPAQNPDQAQADLETLLEFIRRLIGAEAEYELDTLAYMVQTGKRPGNLLFLVGDPGVGKSTYVLLMRAMFDGIGRNHGGQIDGTKLMAESSRRFAFAGVEGYRIISVRELPDHASPTAMAQITSSLKQFVDVSGDADFVQIERKGKDIQAVQNFARFVIASNYENALRVEQNDRRIFFVRCSITVQDRPPPAYYDRLNAIIEAPDRLATLWRYLRNERDVREYNPAKAPPVSDAKLEAQINAMENPAERHVAATLFDLRMAGREMLDLAELADGASDASENEYRNTSGAVDDRATYNFRRPLGPEQLALRYLATQAVKLGQFKTSDGKKRVPTIYVFTGTEMARKLVGAGGPEVRQALERDRDRHPLGAQHPLRRFAGPVHEPDGEEGR